ncbi:RNA-binding protein S1, partial [Thermus scotoductus]
APEGAPPPRPRRLPKQSPEFENKLKSFLRGTGGFGGKGGKKGGKKKR